MIILSISFIPFFYIYNYNNSCHIIVEETKGLKEYIYKDIKLTLAQHNKSSNREKIFFIWKFVQINIIINVLRNFL